MKTLRRIGLLMILTLVTLFSGQVFASNGLARICQSQCRVAVGDYSLVLPEIGVHFLDQEEPSLEGTLAGQYTDEDQQIIYQARARNRYGNVILVTVLQRENATEHFGDFELDELSIVAYASTADMVDENFQALIWVDYIDPEYDRHLVVVIETSSKNLENYSVQFWNSAVSLR